jgi:hypothetical protein
MQVSLGAQVLFHRKRLIKALRLEHHAHVTPHSRRLARYIVTGENGASSRGHHHGGENAEQSRLAAPIGAEQAEDLALSHGEADA